jgi:hypothetical protein
MSSPLFKVAFQEMSSQVTNLEMGHIKASNIQTGFWAWTWAYYLNSN